MKLLPEADATSRFHLILMLSGVALAKTRSGITTISWSLPYMTIASMLADKRGLFATFHFVSTDFAEFQMINYLSHVAHFSIGQRR